MKHIVKANNTNKLFGVRIGLDAYTARSNALLVTLFNNTF